MSRPITYGSPSERIMKIDSKDQATWPLLLQENMSILKHEEKMLVKELLAMGQQHLFATWDIPGVNDPLKHAFLEQMRDLNKGYPGGLLAYTTNARGLLQSAKRGDNPFEGWTPKVPEGVRLDPATEECWSYEQAGIPHIGKCGFVLVAGGLGERLGYNGIKVALPSQTVTGASYLELYCQQILHMQKRYASSTTGMLLPLAIMVSDDTADKTLQLLEEFNYFGLEKTQVTLMKQGKVPALLSNSAHMALASSYVLEAKPHGHGDVHSLMHDTGTARRWKALGVTYLVFFQDTNGLAFYSLPAMLGVSERMNLEVNSLAVARKAKQAVGALTKLVHEDGREMTVNVEYNQLDPLLRATINPLGDVNDPTGCSPYPGNINKLLFQIEPYVKTLNRTDGVMPEFVNPKYTDASKNLFKKPTRLECMMQDYPKLLNADARVGFTSMPDWFCFSPCKNNLLEAAAAVSKGGPAASAYTAECDQYFVFAELLRRMGASLPCAPTKTIAGVPALPSPRIVLHPSVAIFPFEIAQRFPCPARITLSAGATLIVNGDVVIEELKLVGSLQISAAPGSSITIKAAKAYGTTDVYNEGHVLRVLGPGVGREVDVMRGYVLECVDMCCASTALDGAQGKKAKYIFNGRSLLTAEAFAGWKEQEQEKDAGACDCVCCGCCGCSGCGYYGD